MIAPGKLISKMNFLKHRGTVKETPTHESKVFELMGLVQSIEYHELPGRYETQALIARVFFSEPVMLNGETEHNFSFIIPNSSISPANNRNRMKFWLCYNHKQAVMLDETGEPYVPLLDEEDMRYFTHRYLKFRCQIITIADGTEYIEIDYVPYPYDVRSN